MACNDPQEEWTIVTETDGSGAKGLLVFCFSIDGTNISGEVSELPVDGEGTVIGDPVYLSGDVTGTDEPIPGPANLSFLAINFPWGDSRVMMAGVKFRGDTPRTFRGRFSAFASAELASAAAAGTRKVVSVTPQAPGDGDTGTGTGTQT
jgi:hypothetical protein